MQAMEITKELLERSWPLTGVSVAPMPRQGNGGRVGIVEATEGKFVFKSPGPWKRAPALERDLSGHDFLLNAGFQHIPQLLKTRDGTNSIDERGTLVFLYEFVEGEAPHPTPETYTELAKILAELHAIKGFPFESDYKPSDAIPELITEAGKYAFKDEYVDILKSIPSFSHLPLVPVHTELTPQNCVLTQSGTIVVIDWDEAGLAPAVLDLGVGLINHFVTEDLEINDDWASAYYRTYFSLRPMDAAKKEYIYHAALFWACAWVGYGDTVKRWERIKWAIANKPTVLALITA